MPATIKTTDTPAPTPSSHSPEDSSRRPKTRWRRARRACLSCRARKVRCDVLQRAPCGNCAWDNLECVVVRRRNATYYNMGAPAVLTPDITTKQEPDSTIEMDSLEHTHGPMEPTDNAVTAYPPSSMCEEHGDHLPNTGMSRPQDCRLPTRLISIPCADDMFGLVSTSMPDQTLPQYLDTLAGNVIQRHPPAPSNPRPNLSPNSLNLPAFIKPLPARFDSDDLDFLRSKGALTLPSRECQDALLWSFFEYVYPFMPILDLDQFLHSVEDADGKAGKISLLLFQAVLFTGTAHVPLHHLQEAGFTTRKNARKAFFQRVRLLYDFNTESDHLVLVQALLLMTLWYETPDEHRNTWHWIDVSISQAFTSGLNQDPSFFKSKYSPRVQRLRRRVWWVCFMRDRMVSLGMRRPPTIRDDDYNVSMLGESDFKPAAATGSQKARRDICSYRDDARKRHDLATLCVEKAKLCRCWRHYVRTHYTIFSENADDGGTGIYRVPRPDDKDVFATCNEDLLRWNNELPENCKYLLPICDTDNPGDNTVALNRTILHMTYFAAVASLHRSRFTALLQDPKASLFEQELSKLSMQNAATHISNMAAAIHTSGMDIFLPTLAISVLVSAAVIHLLEVKGVIQADTKKAYQGYRRCMAVIESLKDMYVVANLAKDAMEWAFIEPMSNEQASSHYTSSISDPCRNLAALQDSEMSELFSTTDATSPNLSLSGGSSMEEAISAVEQAWGDFTKAVKQDTCIFDEAVASERQGLQMEELEGFESCIMFSDLDS